VRFVRTAVVIVTTCGLLGACGVHVPSPTPSAPTSAAPGKPAAKKKHAGPGTVSGKILDNGKPVAGATVRVVAWPNGAVLGKQHKGQKVPTKRLGSASSASDGTYAVKLGKAGGKYQHGHLVNVEVDVFAHAGVTQWNVSLRVLHGKHNGKHIGKTKPLHLTFDLGHETVIVGGHKSHAQVVH
jgi:hypothetical protein